MRPLPLVIILMVLDHVAFNGCRVGIALFAIHLKSSALTVGTLMGLYALLPALLSVPAGRWIDRVGLQRPMLLGSAGIALGVSLPGLVPALPTLYATALLVGTSFMLVNVAAYHAVGVLSSDAERPVNFSYVALGFSISGFVAPMLTGVTIDQLGFRAAFLVLALFGLLPALMLKAQPLPAPPAHGEGGARRRGRVLDLLEDRRLRRMFVCVAILTVSWDIYTFAIPVYGTQIGLTASQIGIVMGSFAAATFVVRLAMPLITQRVGPWLLLASAMTLAAASYVAIGLVHQVPLLMAALFSLGLGLGAPQPVMLTLLHESAPAGRAGEALGLRTTIINMSQTVMPLVFGAVGAALGMAPLFFTMAAVLGGGSLLARRARRDEPQARAAERA